MKLSAAPLGAFMLVAIGLVAGEPRDFSVSTSDDQKSARRENTSDRTVARATDYIGQEVVSSSQQPLGEIVDLAVHGPQGRVIYAVLASDGLFGLGQNLFAVPIDALVRDRTSVLVLDISPLVLDEKDAFDPNDWPTRANQALMESSP